MPNRGGGLAAQPPTERTERTVSGVDSAARSALVESLGGRRGLLDSGLPTVVFVAAHAAAGLRAAVLAALATGAVLYAVRLARHEPLQQAVSGLLGLALAAYIATRTGDAKGFFVPGIVTSALCCVVVTGSVLLRRPLVGVVVAAVEGHGPSWRSDPALLRGYSLVTLGWAAVFALRAGVQGALYLGDARYGWLAAAKLALGYPVTLVAVALTVLFIRRVSRAAAMRAVAESTVAAQPDPVPKG